MTRKQLCLLLAVLVCLQGMPAASLAEDAADEVVMVVQQDDPAPKSEPAPQKPAPVESGSDSGESSSSGSTESVNSSDSGKSSADSGESSSSSSSESAHSSGSASSSNADADSASDGASSGSGESAEKPAEETSGSEKETTAATAKPETTEAPAAPTKAATAAPTAAPTEAPTEAPTAAPTEAPTAAPTEAPTAAPTEAPTAAPTAVPTEVPTAEPIEAPTAAPTEAPTEAPTAAPTEAPTEIPTEAPTAEPTKAPEETAEPTQAPAETSDPTAEPTVDPTATAVPDITVKPTPTIDPIATAEPDAPEYDNESEYQQILEIKRNPYSGWYGVEPTNEQGMRVPVVFQTDYPDPVCIIRGIPRSVAGSGCAATSLSMIIAYFTGNTQQTPYTLFCQAYDEGRYWGSGWDHATLSHYAKEYGLKSEWIPNKADLIREKLAEGKPIIAHMGKGIFTKRGHYIVLRGMTEDGKILINDPVSPYKTEMAFPLKTILTQARGGHSFMVCWLDEEDSASAEPTLNPEETVRATQGIEE